MFEELIKKALKGVGLPEELHAFVTVEKEDEIAPRIASMRKAIPKPVEPKKIEKMEDLLTDESLMAIINPWKDNSVTKGIDTFKLKHPEIKKEEVKPDAFKLDESPEFKEMKESLKTLTDTLAMFKTKETTEQRQAIIKKTLTDTGIPEAMHEHFTVKDEDDEAAITVKATAYKQTLTDLGLKKMPAPGVPAGGSVVDATVSSYAKDKNEKGSDSAKIPGKKLI